MKRVDRLLLLTAFVFTATVTTSCREDYDDYSTSAIVNVTAPDSIVVDKMQGTVVVTNLNNKESYSSSDFKGTSVTMDVLRGCYSVAISGTVSYRDQHNVARSKDFRASSSYCEMISHPSTVQIELIFM